MLPNLPTEIWFRIAYFVPDEDLFRLATVNHLFHALATDKRYRTLVIDDDHPQALMRKIGRIENEPVVAARVRSLAIHPNTIRSACRRTGKTPPFADHGKSPYWPESFLSYENRHPNKENLLLADHVLNALSKLTNIHSYTIKWKQAVDSGRTFCLPFLAAVWSLLLQSNICLCSLTLDMSLSHLRDVLSLIPSTATGNTFAHLTSLSLHFTNTGFSYPVSFYAGYASYSEQTLPPLASFLNLISPSLHSLTLSSFGHLDFSFLFLPLQTFPHLRELSLSIPCDARHLTNPCGFTTFLEAHKHQLEVLSFSPQYCCLQSSPSQFQSQQSIIPFPSSTSNIYHSEKPAEVVWEHLAFSRLSFPTLRTLELGLNVLGPGGKRVLPCILYVAVAVAKGQLTLTRAPVNTVDYEPEQSTVPLTLTIMGCIISLADLDDLVTPFSEYQETRAPSRRLKSLVLEVHALSVHLLDLLSSRLPYLETLELTYRWVGEAWCSNAADFISSLHAHSSASTYANWNLKKLELRCSRQDDDARWPCQRAIRDVVPGLRD